MEKVEMARSSVYAGDGMVSAEEVSGAEDSALGTTRTSFQKVTTYWTPLLLHLEKASMLCP